MFSPLQIQLAVTFVFVRDGNRRYFITLLDRVHDVLTFDHASEHRMLAVQPGGSDMGDEELGPVRVGPGIRHGQDSRSIVLEIAMEFVAELIARPAGSVTLGTAGLDHEILDHAVELEAIIEAFGHQFLEVIHGFRHLVAEQFDPNISAWRFDRGNFHPMFSSAIPLAQRW